MTRTFNVSGACNPRLHYMVNLEPRLYEIKKMIDAGKYFTINRARQYGKTTLLRILSGLETADSGTITGVVTPAVVFQEDRLCPQLTAVDNLVLTGHGLTAAQARSDLRSLGFTEADLRLPAVRLSGGQKRRAALLRALLCQDAQTLLMDEPFTGMDADLVRDAAAVTRRLAGERPTILVTHDRTAAELLGWPIREI